MNPALWSSKSVDWSTPPEVFNYLDWIYHFTLDPCASDGNAKPARTDTTWWHDCAVHGEIHFIRGRLRFGGGGTGPFGRRET